MKIFNSVHEYEKTAKIGDLIAFQGHGIVDGLNIESKHDVYKVSKINPITKEVFFREYRGRKNLGILPYMKNQKVLIIDKKAYSNLPVLW